MLKLIRAVWLIFVISQSSAGQTAGSRPTELDAFFRNFAGLSEEQIRDIHGGMGVAKILQARAPEEVFVFGAIYINSTPERYLKMASDLDSLRKASKLPSTEKVQRPAADLRPDGF